MCLDLGNGKTWVFFFFLKEYSIISTFVNVPKCYKALIYGGFFCMYKMNRKIVLCCIPNLIDSTIITGLDPVD